MTSQGLLGKLNARKNMSFAAGEFMINTALLFVSYRLLIRQGGIEAVGIWSTLYACTNLIRMGDAGVAVAATRFLALWDIDNDAHKIRTYAETGLLTNIAQFGLLALVAYFCILPFINSIVGSAHAHSAVAVLPWLLLGFFLLNVSGSILGTLQGLHLGYRRSTLSVLGTSIQLVAVIPLVPRLGLLGLALAQIVQHASTAVVGWLILRKTLRSGWLPVRFSGAAFRDMLRYSLKAQFVNVANGLLEPVAKLMVGYFGGMAGQGLFELAYKTVLIPRNLIASFLTASSPTVTALFQRDMTQLRAFYAKSLRIAVLMMSIAALGVILFAFIPSLLWLNRVDSTYWFYVALLSIAFWFNVSGIPAYILGMASGNMRNNAMFAAGALVMILVVGFPAGHFFESTGVVVTCALAIGGCGLGIAICNRRYLASTISS